MGGGGAILPPWGRARQARRGPAGRARRIGAGAGAPMRERVAPAASDPGECGAARPMTTPDPSPAPASPPLPDYEGTPLTRGEYIAAIVHLYRGELYRATVWRIRLDTTTNWAVLATAGLLAFSFRDIGRSEGNPHWALLIGTLLITLFLGYEARRYQVFDIWRARVRKIEENFYGPILRRNPVSPQREWGERVARDLLQPRYKISFATALRARFMRNYWSIYAVLFLSWLLKIVISPEEAHTLEDVRLNLDRGSGMIPWWSALVYVGVFLVLILGLIFLVPAIEEEEDQFWARDAGDGQPLDL